ncbi:TPA: hypothetical protein DDZ86_03780 [Candidatus Dependentiae bacterium]|nr:MAG: hypothetical protein UW09_C0003G0110 [candidate division TM6 bacterium GW2011_GWF2_43_87]HBL98736.1 hypothetical protein [Candidatus Dependentiae bacterium]
MISTITIKSIIFKTRLSQKTYLLFTLLLLSATPAAWSMTLTPTIQPALTQHIPKPNTSTFSHPLGLQTHTLPTLAPSRLTSAWNFASAVLNHPVGYTCVGIVTSTALSLAQDYFFNCTTISPSNLLLDAKTTVNNSYKAIQTENPNATRILYDDNKPSQTDLTCTEPYTTRFNTLIISSAWNTIPGEQNPAEKIDARKAMRHIAYAQLKQNVLYREVVPHLISGSINTIASLALSKLIDHATNRVTSSTSPRLRNFFTNYSFPISFTISYILRPYILDPILETVGLSAGQKHRAWLRKKAEQEGLRSLNNQAEVTNYKTFLEKCKAAQISAIKQDQDSKYRMEHDNEAMPDDVAKKLRLQIYPELISIDERIKIADTIANPPAPRP